MKQENSVAALVCLLVIVAAGPAMSAPRIKAETIRAPAAIDVGHAIPIPLEQYWRGNVKADAQGLRDDKKAFPHVPNLIEYRIDLPVGGEFELQAKYRVDKPSPTRLTVDGEPAGMLFEQHADHQDHWSGLARVGLRPGTRAIRFTSRYVETPFPAVKALQLLFRGGEVPPPKPAPPVFKPRPHLPQDWYKHITRKIHGDFHTAGFIRGIGKDFDIDRYGETLTRSGVNAICAFAKGHHGYAYYNTKVGTRHPGLDFDLMKAQIEACHKRGIVIWVYFSVGVDELYVSTRRQPAKGRVMSAKIKVETDSPYVRDNLWPMIAEVVRGYDVDGVFFDFAQNEAFVAQTVQLIKDIKPGVVVAYNHQWEKSYDELKKLDVLELESWNHKMPLYHWQYFARYARGAVPMTAMTIRFWKGWGDFGGLTDEAMLRYHAATGLANGCALTIGDHLHPHGRLNPAVYERIGRVYRDAMKIEPYVTDAESIPYVALIRPGKAPLTKADDSCRALLDAGFHFTVIDDARDPSPFKVVVVPDGSKIKAAQLARLDQYVRNGGRLLVTGKPARELQPLLGVRVESEDGPSYIRIDPKVLSSPPATDLYTYLNVTPAEPDAGTSVLAPLVWQMERGTIHQSRRQSPPREEGSGLAAITWRKHGKGQVIYSAAPLLQIYATWGYTPMRQILKDLIHRMVPPAERLAQIETPCPLEVSLNRQGDRTIVHLVHCPMSRRTTSSFNKEDYAHHQPIIDGLPTVSGARLHLARSLVRDRRIRVVPAGTEVKPSQSEPGVVTLEVPDFRISTVLVIE